MVLKKGWEPLPLSLKILYLITALGTILSLFTIGNITKQGIYIIGYYTTGSYALVYGLITVFCGGLLLFTFWNRRKWAWKYGIIYLAFNILNYFLSCENLIEKIVPSTGLLTQSSLRSSLQLAVWIVIAINVLFIYYLCTRREYFEQEDK